MIPINKIRVLALMLLGLSSLYGQTTQTVTLSPTSSDHVKREDDWGTNFNCDDTTYHIGYTDSVGWKETGTSACLTSHNFAILKTYDHPNFTNSQITQVKLDFDINTGSFPTGGKIYVYSTSGCGSTYQSIYDCINENLSPARYVIGLYEDDNASGSKHITATITSSTNPNLGIFIGSSTSFYIGFGHNNVMLSLNNVTCEVTYTCNPPSAPTNLNLSPLSSSQIKLDWNAVSGATSYKVYDCSSNLIGTSSTNTFTATGMSAMTSYSFQVTAVDNCDESGPSTCESAYTTVGTPQNLVATATSVSDISLSWNAVAGATSYDVFGCNGGLILNTATNSAQLSGLNSATTYSYKVRAKSTSNGGSSSPFSSCKSATTCPTVPTNLTATGISGSEIELNWSSVGVASYNIYTCSGTYIGNTSGTSYTVTGLGQMTTHSFKIRATNNCGSSGYTSCQSASTLIAKPQNLTLTPISTSIIDASWDANPSALSYDLYDCGGSFIANTTSTSHTITGLTAGTVHSFKVRSVGSSGSSIFTDCESARTFLQTPVVTVSQISGNTLRASWNAIAGASYYDVYYCNGSFVTDVNQTHLDFQPLSPGDGISVKVVAIANNSGTPPVPNTYSQCASGFIDPYCAGDITLNGVIMNYSRFYATKTKVLAGQGSKVEVGYSIKAEAEKYIDLTSTFEAKAGSLFIAQIKPCRFPDDPNGLVALEDTSTLKVSDVEQTSATPQQETLHTNDVVSGTSVDIFPNPNGGQFRISLNGITADRIDIVDVHGQNIKSLKVFDSGSLDVDISDFPNGMYFLRHYSEKAELKVHKIIKR